MKDVLAFALGALAFVGIVEWIVGRIQTRRPTPRGSGVTRVTRRWLHENRYDREGDEP